MLKQGSPLHRRISDALYQDITSAFTFSESFDTHPDILIKDVLRRWYRQHHRDFVHMVKVYEHVVDNIRAASPLFSIVARGQLWERPFLKRRLVPFEAIPFANDEWHLMIQIFLLDEDQKSRVRDLYAQRWQQVKVYPSN